MKIVCNDFKNDEVGLGDIIRINDGDNIFYRMVIVYKGRYNMIELDTYEEVYSSGFDTIDEMMRRTAKFWSRYDVIPNKNIELRLTK